EAGFLRLDTSRALRNRVHRTFWVTQQISNSGHQADARNCWHRKGGYRSSIATSMLRRVSFRDIANLIGGFDALESGLPYASRRADPRLPKCAAANEQAAEEVSRRPATARARCRFAHRLARGLFAAGLSARVARF